MEAPITLSMEEEQDILLWMMLLVLAMRAVCLSVHIEAGEFITVIMTKTLVAFVLASVIIFYFYSKFDLPAGLYNLVSCYHVNSQSGMHFRKALKVLQFMSAF